MEKDLIELAERLKGVAGANLKSVVLYGSGATGEFQPRHSDLNVLCVVERLGAGELEKYNSTARWWAAKGHPAPLLMTLEELRRSADVFAIELLDIRSSRRILFGEDLFAGFEVPLMLHRQQVERELRTRLIRLRQEYLAAPRKTSVLRELLTASVSTFVVLFRHALIVFGEESPKGKRAVVERLAAVVGFDAAAFHAVLDVRERKCGENDWDPAVTFVGYLDAVTRVVDEVDRRLAVDQ